MRRTKSFSFDEDDMKWISRFERDAKRQAPAASNSKHLVHVIKYYLNHQRMLRQINTLDQEPCMGAAMKGKGGP